MVGCEGRTTPEHAASALPSSHAAAASAAGVISGEARGVERKSARRGKKKPQTPGKHVGDVVVSFWFFGGHGGHSEVWRGIFECGGGHRCSRRGAVSESKNTKMAKNRYKVW